MKKLLSMLLFIGVTVGIHAQNPAILDLESSDQGVLIPRMTTSEMNGISSPVEGLFIYNTDATSFYVYRSGAWSEISGSTLWTQDSTDIYRVFGKVGVGEPYPDGKFHISNPGAFSGVTFTGTGVDDLSVNNSDYTGTGTSFAIRIQNTGPVPNIIEISDDGGATWSSPFPISNPIQMGEGATASFDNTGGHTFGDRWDWSVGESFPDILIVQEDRVGIGTNAPTQKLHLDQGVLLLDESSIGVINSGDNIFIGDSAGIQTTPGNPNPINGSSNTFIGQRAGQSNTDGFRNTITGYEAFKSNTQGDNNSAFGYLALNANTSGTANTAAGFGAMRNNTTGGFNAAYGLNTLSSNISGSGNTAIGPGAMQMNTSGNVNVGIGSSALFFNTIGDTNTAVGYQTLLFNTEGIGNSTMGGRSMHSNTTGDYNTAAGFEALYSNTTGYENTAVGYEAMYENISGFQNTAVGREALRANETGLYNVALGYQALLKNTSGNQNVAAGLTALFENTTGSFNTAYGFGTVAANTEGEFRTGIGWAANSTGTDYDNTTGLGNSANCSAADQVRIGNSAVTSIGGYEPWTDISDARFKSDVKEDVMGLDFIKELRPVTYYKDVKKIDDWWADNYGVRDSSLMERNYETEKSTIRYTGFIAQEVEATANRLGYNFSGVDAPKNDRDFYGLRYSTFTVPLVKAVQELAGENEKLRNEVSEQTEKINMLINQIESMQAKLDQISNDKNSIE